MYAGAGIHVFIGISTGSLPNNGMIISLNTAERGYRLRFFCRSDAMMNNVGMLIGPDETAVTTGNVFEITHLQPGELSVENRHNQIALTAHDQGVYTCRIPLQSREMVDVNIGIYPNGFSSECVFLNSTVCYIMHGYE